MHDSKDKISCRNLNVQGSVIGLQGTIFRFCVSTSPYKNLYGEVDLLKMYDDSRAMPGGAHRAIHMAGRTASLGLVTLSPLTCI